MARLIKTRVEMEGRTHEQLAVVEGEEPRPWGSDASLGVVGRPTPRVDGSERVSGRAVYTYDVALPGMLYARVLRSPHPHARIRRIDASRALALPGVRAVLTHESVPPIPWSNGANVLNAEVRFAGEEVAAVAADDPDVAADALALIDVDYEPLPFVTDAEAALRPDAPKVHPEGNLVGGKPEVYARGDLARGFAEGEVTVEATYRTQTALHNCLESHGTVAAWSGDELTVYESTQHVYGVREGIADALGLPLHKVRAICQYMGGGFGSKQEIGKHTVLAALLARETQRLVQLMLTREDENLAAGNRHPTVQRLRLGAKRDGTLTAVDLVATAAIGAYGDGAMAIAGPAREMYRCPNVRTEVRAAFTNTGPTTAFRAPGYVEGAFPLESLLDELAGRLGIDPLELRRRNYADEDPVSGRPYSAKHLDECYRLGAERIGWPGPGGAVETSGTKRRALGVASQVWGGGGGPPAYAVVQLNSDGTAELILGGQDIGTGTKTALAMIAAEELEIGLDQLTVRLGDSAAGPYAPVSAGSMTVPSLGPAVRKAAVEAKRELREIAAGLLDVKPDEVEVRNGEVRVRGRPDRRLTFAEITGRIGHFTIVGRGSRGMNPDGLVMRTFGAQFAEVEVDVATGEARVLRVVSVHDFGRVVNPLGAASQVEGGVVQGVGYALTEERVIDEASGIVLNPNLEDYKVPSALDVPRIEFVAIDRPDERANAVGAKGLGEPPLIPTAPAIANAIARAIGVRFLELPITRDRILDALAKKGGGDARRTEGGVR